MSVASKLKELKEKAPLEEPKTVWDRIIFNTPVVMTVVATILAGLSSSEMSQAQYHRSMAAQYQSKAGDQWNFFQAKRLREAGNQNSVDLLEGLKGSLPLAAAAIPAQAQLIEARLAALSALLPGPGQTPGSPQLKASVDQADAQQAELASQWKLALADPQIQTAIGYLSGDGLPRIEEKHVDSPAISALLAAIDAGKHETDTIDLVRKVKRSDLDDAEAAANANADAFDTAVKPTTTSITQLSKLAARDAAMLRTLHRGIAAIASSAGPLSTGPGGTDPLSPLVNQAGNLQQMQDEFVASLATARLRFDARRYHQESLYNFAVGRLFEVEVRRSSGLSDHNRDRSTKFFYGMLVAQAAVTIATFSLALKQKSVLWALASSAGLLAISLGVYVYLFT